MCSSDLEAKRRLGEFSQARAHISEFNRKAGRKHNYAELAERMLADLDFAEAQLANPTATEIEALNVNASSDESRPMLTVDGRTLFFSSNRSRSNGSNHGRRDPNTLTHYDDVYRSKAWGKGKAMQTRWMHKHRYQRRSVH